MSYISTAHPLSIERALQHAAYDQGRREGRDDAMNEQDVVARDRDETRRLLYMALYARRTDRYNLVGTLVNALAHHGSGLDPDEVGEHVLGAVGYGDNQEHVSWLRQQITRLTSELDSGSL